MLIVEKHPKDQCFIAAIDEDVQSYFHGEAQILSCRLGGKKYGFVCHQEGIQVKNNEVKALYGPALVCDTDLQGLSEEEAKLVERYLKENEFDLADISIH
ncbi:hypothetical protein ACFFHM_13265 [Halalkalibacter kiskunsagensis]|uniref:Uncharacterized protein n=1 Tax=Halalkalibacter kiskunsagensis TaxID=1548599 RepID=A0ABV6KDP5_9BACI